MRGIFLLLRHSRALFMMGAAASVLGGLSNAAFIALTHYALSQFGRPGPGLIAAYIALCLFIPGMRFASQLLLLHSTQVVVAQQLMRLSRQILASPLLRLEQIGTPTIQAVLTQDVANVTAGLAGIPVLCLAGVMLVGCLAYLAWLSWAALASVILFLFLGAVAARLAAAKAMPVLQRAQEDTHLLFGHLRTLTDATKELMLHQARRRVFLSDLLDARTTSYRRNNMIANAVFNGASAWATFQMCALCGLLLFVLPSMASLGAATVTGFLLVILYMIGPIDVIWSQLPALNRANVALQHIESLGLSLGDVIKPETPVAPESVTPWREIRLAGVTHSYYREADGTCFTLGPLDLRITPGELIFLTGGNGSGKSTLAKLLCGLYIAEEGQLLLDGEPVTDANRERYRQYFTMVFADGYVFESLLGIETPQLDERARQHLVNLQLSQCVQVQDGKLSTVSLSHGQRKRLALLTAYLEDRSIYIFDEWAADQDPVFKRVFYHEILPELIARGKTVIAISHDDHYYSLAHRIIRLDYGRIAKTETPADLFASATVAAAPGL
jgi:putative pyoverdin transport system ATP-binding/permease protein